MREESCLRLGGRSLRLHLRLREEKKPEHPSSWEAFVGDTLPKCGCSV